ncbi:hypothetical protein [Vagococcus proximus]|uniref:hypothetical protein n=1 Tax=Vagococcus proximus TaxID=2991417 RepID=UPI0023B84938|nr:hypothetical protein [Vagococcus proximus]
MLIDSVVYLSEGIVPLMIVTRQPILRINNVECCLDYAAGFVLNTAIDFVYDKLKKLLGMQ